MTIEEQAIANAYTLERELFGTPLHAKAEKLLSCLRNLFEEPCQTCNGNGVVLEQLYRAELCGNATVLTEDDIVERECPSCDGFKNQNAGNFLFGDGEK